MYATRNFKTKKALKEAVAQGERVTVYQPGLGDVPNNGTVALEGPHYPQPHTWYASATLKDGVIVAVRQAEVGTDWCLLHTLAVLPIFGDNRRYVPLDNESGTCYNFGK